MKEFFRVASVGVFCLALMPFAVSCGNDEPEGGEGGTIVEIEGTRISEIGNYSIEYDNDGRPSRISSRDTDLTIDYKKGVIRVVDNYDEEEEKVDVKFKDGFISNISESWNYRDEYYQEKGSGKAEFKYSNGYLVQIKIESESEEKDFEDGTTGKYKESSVANLTWNDGDMVAYVENYSETGDGELYKRISDYTYNYGGVKNVFNQLPVCVTDCWSVNSEWGILAALGLFGKGTSSIPVSMEYSETEDGEKDYSHDKRISISLNINGSISSESYGSTFIDYSYENITRSEVAKSDIRFKPLFKVFRNHKK